MKLNELRQIIREEISNQGTTCYVVINGNGGGVYGVYRNKKLAEEAQKEASYNLAMGGSNYSAYIEQSKLYDELG